MTSKKPTSERTSERKLEKAKKIALGRTREGVAVSFDVERTNEYGGKREVYTTRETFEMQPDDAEWLYEQLGEELERLRGGKTVVVVTEGGDDL